MANGMATKKVTVTLDERDLAHVRELVGAGHASNVSAFVQHAVRVSLRDVTAWGSMLDDALERTGGPPTKEEREWADRQLGTRRRRRRAA